MKIPIRLYSISAMFVLLAGCASPPKPDTRVELVATCKESDKTGCELIYDTLRQHGIVAIGVSSGGWDDVNVSESRAAEARRILSKLSTEGHSFRVIDK